MKNLTLILLLLSTLILNGQIQCGGIISNICNNCRSGAITNSDDFIPNSPTLLKIIKLNLHFILNDNGIGNFTENSDGNGSSA